MARADFAGMIVWYSRRLADLDQTVVKSKRLHEVEALYRAALERGPAERRAFLEEACAGDEELRREVQSLLAYDERAERFLEIPAMQVEANAMAVDRGSSEGTKPALLSVPGQIAFTCGYTRWIKNRFHAQLCRTRRKCRIYRDCAGVNRSSCFTGSIYK